MLVYASLMGAIGAIFHRDGQPSSSEEISRMEAVLQVHGPRRHQNRRFSNFSLCWTHIEDFTPEDRYDQQPIAIGDSALCFDGRLHFRRELASALGVEAKKAATMADSALAAIAWRKWGREALKRLEGVFSIIVIDQTSQTLFAARSPFAAPPLVFHQRIDRFAIASAPIGLFALHDIPKELDDLRIADALVLNNEDAERSFFKGIRTLRSGHLLEVTRGDLRVERFYDILAAPEVRYATDDDYVEAANELLAKCVEDATHANVEPAFTVSSGLDSPTVVVAAIEAMRESSIPHQPPVLGFTHVPEAGWDGRAFGPGRVGDESGPVRALEAMYPELSMEFVDSKGMSIDEGLDDLIRLSEVPPFGWNNNYWGNDINRRARELGRNVVIGGQSGNRTLSFSNRAIFPSLLRQGRFRELHQHLVGYPSPYSLPRKYWGHAVRPLLPTSVLKRWGSFRRNRAAQGWRGFSAISPEYAADMQVEQRMEGLGWDDSYTVLSPREQFARMTLGGTRELGAHTALAFRSLYKIEDRDPLGYARLSEFCAAIPTEQYMHRGQDRWLIKRMMKGRLPEEILAAPRGRQAADWHLRMTRDLPRYRQELDRIADDPDLSQRFDIERIRKVFDTWPDKTPLGPDDHPDYVVAMLGIGRVLSTSRFINFAKGKN